MAEHREMTSMVPTVLLESEWACVHLIELAESGKPISDVEVGKWNPRPYMTDPTGVRFFEEVGRRVARATRKFPAIDRVAISMPGTLLDSQTIVTASRLNIRTRLNASEIIEEQCELSATLCHDMPAMAVGFDDSAFAGDESFAYVSLDEGVGSVLYVGGAAYRGAGVAGSLGRMVVEPDGVYSAQISARGTLEAYVARPWISDNCVSLWEAEQGKRGGDADGSTPFRRALAAAADIDRQSLTCLQLAQGVEAEDPIALNAMATAARYAGYGISCFLAIAHPHKLVLGGRLCSTVPGFAEEVERFARNYSWPNAWNKVDFLHSPDSRRDQRVGAARMTLRLP